MRVALFASPEFALPSYRALRASSHELCCVVTRPDAPKGRSSTPTPTVVGAAALADGLPLLRPERLTRDFIAELAGYAPDLLAVVAYGRILGPTLLSAYPDRVLNVHPSLLPRHRGASPLQAAILEGAEETGVTIMHLVTELDAGDIVLQKRVPLPPRAEIEGLHDLLAAEGASLLVEAIAAVAAGRAPRIPQDPALVTHTAPIDKTDGRIDWTRDAQRIDRQVRAYHTWPGAFTTLAGGSVRIHAARPAPAVPGEPGRIVAAGDAGLLVACGEGALLVTELQPEARRRMGAAEFLRGRGPVTGSQFS